MISSLAAAAAAAAHDKRTSTRECDAAYVSHFVYKFQMSDVIRRTWLGRFVGNSAAARNSSFSIKCGSSSATRARGNLLTVLRKRRSTTSRLTGSERLGRDEKSPGEISDTTHLYLEQQLGFLPPYVYQDLLLLGSQFCKRANNHRIRNVGFPSRRARRVAPRSFPSLRAYRTSAVFFLPLK